MLPTGTFLRRPYVDGTHAASFCTRDLVFLLHKVRLTDAILLHDLVGHLERRSLLVFIGIGMICTTEAFFDALNDASVQV